MPEIVRLMAQPAGTERPGTAVPANGRVFDTIYMCQKRGPLLTRVTRQRVAGTFQGVRLLNRHRLAAANISKMSAVGSGTVALTWLPNPLPVGSQKFDRQVLYCVVPIVPPVGSLGSVLVVPWFLRHTTKSAASTTPLLL